MAKKKSNLSKFQVSSGNWVLNIAVDADIFDDTHVEACTRAIEVKAKELSNQDFMVNPVIYCKQIKPIEDKPKYINTYKVLLNAGMPKKAELLRKIFCDTANVDLALEPISSSLKHERQ